MTIEQTLYEVLGVSSDAKETEIRRAYKTLVTKAHPDKGGNVSDFEKIQSAYHTLSDPEKRRYYDETGRVKPSPEEEFAGKFAGGSFKDTFGKNKNAEKANVAEQITRYQSGESQSHTAGFEAWLRSRGETGGTLYTTEDIIRDYGVTKSSYAPLALPKINIHKVVIEKANAELSEYKVSCQPLTENLEWGQVMIYIKYASINPGDFYTIRTGTYGDESKHFPFIGGHDCIAIVEKVGPGVKSLEEKDWVIPLNSYFGSWQTVTISEEKELLKIPRDLMPLQQAAVLKEMCLAYRLLEDYGNLKPGDCVIFNAGNSTIGQILIQLCRLLKLRCIAVVSPRDNVKLKKLKGVLEKLGPVEVIEDRDSIRESLDKLGNYAKPKLALDAVGGFSTKRLLDTLPEGGGDLIVYGCLTETSPQINWKSWVFNNIQVKGFNLRKWVKSNKAQFLKMAETLGKLVESGLLEVNYTEYDFTTEFSEALDHSKSRQKDTKILLGMENIGLPIEEL